MKLNIDPFPVILVTGVGAVIGYGIIKSLKMSRLALKVIGTDMDPRAVGFRFSDHYIVCPPAHSKNYCEFMIRACLKHNISLIIPGIEQDLDALMEHSAIIESKTAAKTVLNTQRVYEIARDKWKTFLFLRDHGLPTPETHLISCTDPIKQMLKLPFLLKPRFGQAGKGIIRIDQVHDFEYWKGKDLKKYIAQEIIGSVADEYTAGIFGRGQGLIDGPIVMRRKLQYGSTFEAYVDEFPEVRQVILEVSKCLEPVGPTNIQLRIDKGIPKVMEINPRMSSSVSLKAAFGFNEAEMAVRFFVLNENKLPTNIKKGFAQRYIEDMIFLED